MFTTSVAPVGPGEEVQVAIEYQQTLRYADGGVLAALPHGAHATLRPRSARHGPAGRDRRVARHRPRARCLAHHAAGRAPGDGQGAAGDADGRRRRRGAAREARQQLPRGERDRANPVTVTPSSSSVRCRPTATSSWPGFPSSAARPPPRSSASARRQGLRSGDADAHAARCGGAAHAARGDLHHRHVGLDGRQLDRAGEGGAACSRSSACSPAIASTSSSSIRTHARCSPCRCRSTRATLGRARSFVGGLRPTAAPRCARRSRWPCSPREASGLVRQVVFLTDGAVGNEDELFRLIHERLADRRLFTVGIGSAPNAHFMRKAAQFGRGTHTTIGDVAEVQAQMGALFRKLESPVLTDVAIDWPAGSDAWPGQVPDLYAGEPIVATASCRRSTARSWSAAGSPASRGARLPLAAAGGHDGVHALWARAKIDALADARGRRADANDVRAAIVRVALAHHLVSRHTSLVAVDVTPTMPAGVAAVRTAIPGNLPHGAGVRGDLRRPAADGDGIRMARRHRLRGTAGRPAARRLQPRRHRASARAAHPRTERRAMAIERGGPSAGPRWMRWPSRKRRVQPPAPSSAGFESGRVFPARSPRASNVACTLLTALAARALRSPHWHGGQATYVHAKAVLGQRLLLRSLGRGRAAAMW